MNCSILEIASRMSLNRRSGGGLKDKNSLALRSFQYLWPQRLPVAEIGLETENIREAIL